MMRVDTVTSRVAMPEEVQKMGSDAADVTHCGRLSHTLDVAREVLLWS